jgi:RimJ/RimL family protein N-acetyltransferase
MRRAACELLFAQLSPTARETRISHLDGALGRQAELRASLLVARRGERLLGAVVLDPQPGRTAVLTMPRIVNDAPSGLFELLVERAIDSARELGVKLVQCLLEDRAGPDASALQDAGFRFLAELVQMSRVRAQFPTEPPPGELHFEPYDVSQDARLAALVEQTYVGSLDCPAIEGVRAIDDVLAGYRAAGEFDAALWKFVQYDGREVGCLLLTDQPELDQCELTYMGLVSAARGQARGVQIARQAQWMTAATGRSRLVLAVDAANLPALEIYRRAGFTAWDRRSVFVCVVES